MEYEKISTSLMSSLDVLWTVVLGFAPRIFSALFLLFIGYLVAKLISKVVKVALIKADVNRLCEKVGLAQLLSSWKISPNLALHISKLSFMFVFLIFLISSADVLELEGLSNTIDKFIQYLPNILGAFFVFFLASVGAHFVREAMHKAGDSLNIDFSKALANVLYYSLLLIGLVLAIGQLKIETDFLTHVIEILLISSGVALALSVGFGSRDVSKNLVSGIYLKESLEEGAQVKVGDYEGELISIKPVCFELMDSSGRVIILPNSRLLEIEILQTAKPS